MAVPAASHRGHSTAPHAASVAEQRRARAARRAFLVLVTVFLALGATNFLGPKMASVEAASDGLTLRADYVWLARPGLHTQWSLTVSRPGGFTEPIVLAIDREYVALFNDVKPRPAPAASTATPDAVVWTFAPPPGEQLAVDLDARVSPSLQWGTAGVAAVMAGDRPAVSVQLRTRILP